jgi:lactate dehydrogenase-like 2-hydroxyacid dehydrogenase
MEITVHKHLIEQCLTMACASTADRDKALWLTMACWRSRAGFPRRATTKTKRVWRGMIGDLTRREDELGGKTAELHPADRRRRRPVLARGAQAARRAARERPRPSGRRARHGLDALGQIGGRLAQLAKAFDMRVIGIRRDPRTGAGRADAVTRCPISTHCCRRPISSPSPAR